MHQKPNHSVECRRGVPPRLSSGKLPLLLASIALLCIAPLAKAIAPMGDDAELFVTGVVTGSDNSNIFLSHTNATSSGILDLIPGLSYEFGKKGALTTGAFTYSEDFQMFSKSGNKLDYQLANVTFFVKYDDSANKVNIDASFHQADQAEVGIQNVPFLVERDLYHVDGADEISLTEKTSISGGATFDDTHYTAPGYVDYYYTDIPVNFYFKTDPKLDLSAGFRYRDNELGSGGTNSTDYFYNVGARGEFSPTLTGQFNVGYQEEKLITGQTYGGLGADSTFSLAIDPKTSVNLSINDDYSYAAVGSPLRNFATILGIKAELTDQWAVNLQGSYTNYDYITTTQRDNFYSGEVSLSYIVNTHFTITGAYTYSQDDSNITVDGFNDNLVSISGSLRF